MSDPKHNQVEQFILEKIDGVPHLEALLLVWNHRPRKWTAPEMARALYVSDELAEDILASLVQRGLLVTVPGEPEGYYYLPHSPGDDELMEAVDATYRRELIRISA